MSLLERFRNGFKKTDHNVLILTVVFGFLFLYHLDYTTLVSWDEAWYASIARTMVQTGDWMNMKWLGEPFFDHPPMGMWLMAASFSLFGIGEFAARLPSALLGIGTLILVYASMNEMFQKKQISFSAALILGTSVWFAARARSGNLDTIFTFFYMLSVFTALKAHKNPKWFLAAGASFGGLIMTKTLVGVSALPLMLYASFPQWLKIKNVPYVLGGAGIWSVIVMPWYSLHRNLYSEFDHHHFTNIGTRNRELPDYFEFSPAKQVLFYLHMGIRKWYKLWLAASAWVAARWLFSEDKRHILFLILWNVGILFPFLSSEQAQLWHLIPVYLPVSMLLAYALYDGLHFGYRKLEPFMPSFVAQHYVNKLYIALIVAIAILQIKTFIPEIIPEYRYESEAVQISKAAGSYDANIYLDDDFLPEAVYYVGRDITPVSAAAENDPEYKNTLLGLFRTDEQDFVAITRSWAVSSLEDNNIEYITLEENKDFKIIARPDYEE